MVKLSYIFHQKHHILCPIILLLAFTSCTKYRNCDELLATADSLMETRPDSALTLLDSMYSGSVPFKKSDRMRCLLLLAKAQNKVYATMPADSIFEEVVEYYDRHGSSNDQVLAHYLHGCISRDLNDAPKALERYMEAVAHADTTAKDCDYATLYGIYGQMASLFFRQKLPREEIQALKKAQEYSLKAGNIRNYIKNLELQVRPYYALDDTAAIIRTTYRARDLYLKNGYAQEAASVYPVAIFILLKQGRYEEAHAMMEDFEQHSGLFTNGEIEPKRRQYEYSRGMYYEGIHQLDSAEHYYRKALAYGFQFEGSKGLLSLYCTKGDLDSVRKYAQLYLLSVDEKDARQQTEAVLEMKALYDYTQSRKEADGQRRNAERLKATLFILLLIGVVTTLFAILAYQSYKKRKEKEIERLTANYNQSMERLEELRWQTSEMVKDMHILKRVREWAASLYERLVMNCDDGDSKQGSKQEQESDDMVDDTCCLLRQIDEMIQERDGQLTKKQGEIDRLTQENKDVKTELVLLKGYDGLLKLEEGQIVSVFKMMADESKKVRKPNERDWQALKKYFQIQDSEFFIDIKERCGLSELELRSTLLVCLGFSNQELKTILEKSSQRVSNIKADINRKLFGQEGAARLLYNITRKYGSTHPLIKKR